MPLKLTESTQGEDMHAGYIEKYAHYILHKLYYISGQASIPYPTYNSVGINHITQ